MLTSSEIRQKFFEYFKNKGHVIVPSAPIVNKEDPSLMFINAGMNPFKEYFLGVTEPKYKRVADTQKCLRVSGKHNDLEEVGRDSYHHTMFEMLGNWSFGDYFKEEAINMAWELLTDVYGLDKNRLYVTVFEGNEKEGLSVDQEAIDIWVKHLDKDRILEFDKKDNFWEMGATGPCGPCSEIHIDLRSDEERKAIDGKTLVNKDHPQVVEIWNLVFIQYNRKADGNLEALPSKHIDTGMGFERLCMALQGKTSNYETDVFTPLIAKVEQLTGKKYSGQYAEDAHKDIAFRVVVDHIRAVSFAISDGQLPSNTGAGYVIRRILRRGVRYAYSFLDAKEPLMYKLVALLAAYFKDVFPELYKQQSLVEKVVEEEERSFLRTLASGLKRFAQLQNKDGVIKGEDVFELYDTYGFPVDLTRLLAEEQGLTIDEEGFERGLAAQKERSKADALKTEGDWTVVAPGTTTEFVGYDTQKVDGARLLRYRSVESKGKKHYQLVLDKTPFYAESGGQIGDRGTLMFGSTAIPVTDTRKEHELHIHYTTSLPDDLEAPIVAKVDQGRRTDIMRHHSATHLLHAALRQVLGTHVEQKGSLVSEKHLRFDFSHFAKLSEDELRQVEEIVNRKILENIPLEEERNMPIEEAKKAGAMMLFGEKYGDSVRMITFDPSFSRELCGGTHVARTGDIGWFVIKSESAIAAGVRRIEALAGTPAYHFIQDERQQLKEVRQQFKNATHVAAQVQSLKEKNKDLEKTVAQLQQEQAQALKGTLLGKAKQGEGYKYLLEQLDNIDSGAAKSLIFQLEKALAPAVIVFGLDIKGKPQIMIRISDDIAGKGALHAGQLVREAAKHIKGGGGGQAFFATAGGADVSGLKEALSCIEGNL